MRNVVLQNNHKAVLGYLLVQRVILFLAVYECLSRMNRDSKFKMENSSFKKDAGYPPEAEGMTSKDDADIYSYDANGNVDIRNGVTIAYDYNNKPTSIGSTAFVYDYSGHRVKKNGTVYIGKLYECAGGSCVKYIFAGSTRIASKSSTATYYYHTDHLGSSSVITDAIGNKAQETYYYPYGEIRYNSGSATHFKFTGQEYDDETGLYYYGARYYDPVIGRFISADTIVPNFANPQDLNRYTYAGNNPLTYIDPTGHFKFKILWKTFVSAAIGAAVTVLTAGSATPFVLADLPQLIAAGAAGGAASGATSAALNGGNLNNILNTALKGAVIGGIGGGVYGLGGPQAAIGMLAGGAVYATAKGGLNGLAYYAGGFLGGLTGATLTRYVQFEINNPSGTANSKKSQSVAEDKLGVTEERRTQADTYYAEDGKPKIYTIEDPNREIRETLVAMCKSPDSGCGANVDFKAWNNNLKFDTLHLRWNPLNMNIEYHWDQYNFYEHPFQHLGIDTMKTLFKGGGL